MAGDNVKTVRIKPPTLGLDSESAPAYVDVDHAVLIENLLVTRNGKLILRGEAPMTNVVTAGATGAGVPTGFMTAETSGPTAVAVLFPAYIPSVGNTCMRRDELTEPLVAGISANIATSDHIWRFHFAPVVIGSKCYNGAFQVNPPLPAISSDKIVEWGGTAVVPTFHGWSPASPQSICNHLGRLWVGGGIRMADLSAANCPTSLFWTDIGGPLTNAAADWKDDVSGLVNQIDLDQNLSNPITALGKVGRYMAVFRRDDIWMLYGDTSATFSVRRVIGGIGAASPSVLEVPAGVVFVGSDGNVYLFDGVSTTLLSARWEAFAKESLPVASSVSFAQLDHEWFLMCAAYPSTSPPISPILRMCHLPTRAWMDVATSTSLLSGGKPLMVGNAANGLPFMHDGVSRLTVLSNSVRNYGLLRPRGANDVDSGDTTRAIPARFHSRVHVLGSPLQKAFIKRVAMEYVYSVTSGTPTGGLTISLYDRTGTQLGTTQTVPYGANTTPLRFQFEPFVEASDIQVRVVYTDTSGTPATVEIEIHDLWIEYQETRQSL